MRRSTLSLLLTLASCAKGFEGAPPLQALPPPTAEPAPPEGASAADAAAPHESTMPELETKALADAADAVAAHDVRKAAVALYSVDAVVKTWGAPDQEGRGAIEREAASLLAEYPDAKLGCGRIWQK